MAFRDFPEQRAGVQQLQRSLERGRLAHGYLFTGQRLEELESLARTLAKTLNCRQPLRQNGAATDCCDRCVACTKIDRGNHADVHWVRPESKLRIITIEQMRALMQEIYLKPAEAEHKLCVVVAADRLNDTAANAFLKTLEEPPDRSILVLLTTEPHRLLDTIRSRCLRINFDAGSLRPADPVQMEWLRAFSELASAEQKSLLGRYRLMDVLARKLGELKARIDETLRARSPLEQHEDVEKELSEQWEEELKAAVESEYRRQRGEWLGLLQAWLRDVWLETLVHGAEAHPTGAGSIRELLSFPNLAGARGVAARITPRDGLENLQVMERLHRGLRGNMQEALVLEVGLLQLRL